MLAQRCCFSSTIKRSFLSLQYQSLIRNYFRLQPISEPYYASLTIYNCRSLLPDPLFTLPTAHFSRAAVLKNVAQQHSSTEPNSATPKPVPLSTSELISTCPLSPVPASLRRTVDEYFLQYQPTRAQNEAVSFEEANRVLTVPNALSFARLLSGPIVGYLIFTAQLQIAAPLFLLASITDWVLYYILFS